MNIIMTDNNSATQNTNKFTATKRKSDIEHEEKSAKRMHFVQSDNLLSLPTITCASPGYKPSFKVSANATANMANTPSPMVEDTVMEEDFTDEDEILQTPSSMSCTDYIPQTTDLDLDQGGFTGSLELGWSEMFNDL